MQNQHGGMILLNGCLYGADGGNEKADRAAYIGPAKAAGFRICGYFFDSSLAGALQRNARRDSAEGVPEAGLMGATKRLQPPACSEGFDQLFAVRMDGQGSFVVEAFNTAPA